ncbi:IDEAL domain-containing protein [Aquibacillus koreensis]|uniref:IDEAL domain-containing protein n=1 Tax=Aquibacillus koreensis TaxID=279446 RepID=A0A9X3WMT0_9BACI|nr:IDEAL domain-containing protein [Aquibacillus koreensis]MCT2535536.1 IDEAL domain-containing protein [Aquibacillus koreensis]MDC3420179.1 IDEAL domain-containing protein [Aquibacillus koreensis]
MKKHKVSYKLKVFSVKKVSRIAAKREISYEIKLASKLILDELCFNWNKARLEEEINESIDSNDKEKFLKLSKKYQLYSWEH